MVYLDSHQRSARYLFWRRVLLSLTVFSLLYIGAIKPLQSLLIDKVIFPIASDFALNYNNVQLAADVDEIDLITQWPKPNHYTKIQLLFSGYIWLALALFWIAKSHKLIKILLLYQLALVILMPLAGWLILKGYKWVIIAANIHDTVYNALFIIVGVLAVRSAALSLRKETPA
jgi:hypothetical protein